MTKFIMTDFKQVDKKNTVAKYTSDKYEMTIEVKDRGKNGDDLSS